MELFGRVTIFFIFSQDYKIYSLNLSVLFSSIPKSFVVTSASLSIIFNML